MIRLLLGRRRTSGEPAPLSGLGPLELQVLEALWALPAAQSGVLARQVHEKMAQPLAYTTITTTLDRLCKKNLLQREKRDRAFSYQPRYTRRELTELEARRAIQSLQGSGGQLVSHLIDSVTLQDAALLDELEEKIRRKREALRKGGQS